MIHHFKLRPFDDRGTAGLQFGASLSATTSNFISLDFQLNGATEIVDWGSPPQSSEPRWGFELWKHTCFELFLSFPGTAEYWEWNFSPAGQVCSYHFETYRKNLPLEFLFRYELGGLLQHRALSEVSQYSLSLNLNSDADNRLGWMLQNHRAAEVHMTSVLKLKSGETSYWAPKHPAAKADFHDRTCWARVKL